MKKVALYCLLFVLCLPMAAAAEWLPNFEDVPMMENIHVIEEESFVFSQSEGKIVQTTIVSEEVSRRQFQNFYSAALRELGWKRTRSTRALQTFTRGDEELNIEITETDPLVAQFTLTPKE